MSDLTPHQRDILIAILQGKRIMIHQVIRNAPDDYFDEISPVSYGEVFDLLRSDAVSLFIDSGQDEAVRLYELTTQRTATYRCFTAYKDQFSAEYIDISTNGFIVGGPINQ